MTFPCPAPVPPIAPTALSTLTPGPKLPIAVAPSAPTPM